MFHCIDVYLNWIFVSEEMNDLKGMFDDSHCHQFLSIVPFMHHDEHAIRPTIGHKALQNVFVGTDLGCGAKKIVLPCL